MGPAAVISNVVCAHVYIKECCWLPRQLAPSQARDGSLYGCSLPFGQSNIMEKDTDLVERVPHSTYVNNITRKYICTDGKHWLKRTSHFSFPLHNNKFII